MTGYFKAYTVYVDQDTSAGNNERNVDIIRDGELHFVGETTLDNGLTVGADIGGDIDMGASFAVSDSFVYLSGDWGRVNAGGTDGAAYLLQVQPPSADANYDGMEQYYTPFNYTLTGVTELAAIEFDYDHSIDAAMDKITYFTPVFGGFQAAASWTPKVEASRGLGGVSSVDDGAGLDFSNVWDLAARFENEMDWGSYRVGAGYTHASLENQALAGAGDPTDDRNQWNVAADFNIGDWGVGALYTHDDRGDLDGANSDQRQWIAGVDYTMGAYTLAASYLNQNNEFGADEIDTARYTGGVAYNVGPGVDLRGIVSYIDHDVDAALGSDVQGTTLMLGTNLTF